MGFLTVPASNDPNSPKDVDDYKFSVPTNSNVTVSVNNIIIALDFWVNILNSSYQVVGSAFHASGSTQSIYFTSTLNAGDYYLQIYAVPDANSYLAPYNFTLTQTTINSVIDLSKKLDNILIYPNPATDNLTIVAPQKSEIEILNIEGQIIKDISATENQTAIDISDFANGVYVVEVKTEKGIEVRKFVKE